MANGIHLENFSTGVSVYSEEDAKQKIIMPYLRALGYSENEMRFENPITVQAGSRKVGLSLFGVGEWVGGVVVLVG